MEAEIVRSMLTPDEAFQTFRVSVLADKPQGAEDLRILLRRLELQTKAAHSDSKRAQDAAKDLEAVVSEVETEHNAKYQAFQALLKEHGNKQKLDRRVRQLDRTQRVTLGDRQVLALLDKTRSQQTELNAQISEDITGLNKRVRGLEAECARRQAAYKATLASVLQFQASLAAVESLESGESIESVEPLKLAEPTEPTEPKDTPMADS